MNGLSHQFRNGCCDLCGKSVGDDVVSPSACPGITVEKLGEEVRGPDGVTLAPFTGEFRPVRSMKIQTPDGKVHDLGPGEMLTVEVEAVGVDWDGVVKPIPEIKFVGHDRTPAVFMPDSGNIVAMTGEPPPNAVEKYAPPVGGFAINPGAPPLEVGKEYPYTPGVYGEWIDPPTEPPVTTRTKPPIDLRVSIPAGKAMSANVAVGIEAAARKFAATTADEVRRRMAGATDSILSLLRLDPAALAAEPADMPPFNPGGAKADWEQITRAVPSAEFLKLAGQYGRTIGKNCRCALVPIDQRPRIHGPLALSRDAAGYAAGRRWVVTVEYSFGNHVRREYEAADPATALAAAMSDNPEAVHAVSNVYGNRATACNLHVSIFARGGGRCGGYDQWGKPELGGEA